MISFAQFAVMCAAMAAGRDQGESIEAFVERVAIPSACEALPDSYGVLHVEGRGMCVVSIDRRMWPASVRRAVRGRATRWVGVGARAAA